MKKPTFSKAACAVLFLFLSFTSVGQTLKPFTIRKNVELKGKMLVIGNNILGKDNNPLNDNSVNENISMQYIDIDGDASTFSSSSANLVAPTQKNGNASTCYRVTYAALYWSAMLQSGSRTDINKVKLKLPGASTYNNITGSVIYDAISTPQIPDNNTPYACYADVTSLLATLPSLAGNYTVADVISSVGTNGSTGLAAGWTLFVIYEDPTLSMKSFTSFDGFAALYDGHFETIPVTGFRTPLSGPVDLQFAYAALEGDKTSKSKLEFGGKEVTTPLRGPANNFFNSTIENSWGVSTPRNPSGSNTLGYDTGMLEIKGANPAYIKNNQTSTSFMLQGPSGQADPLFGFMGSYAVDIIAPDIKLTKLVKSSTGTDIGGTDVTLGDYLYYEINYQNLGNDNVTGMTIKDVLPKNIIFNYPADLDLTNAGGVTVQSYDPITKTIIFNVPDGSVNIDDPNFTIRIKAQVVPDCNMLTDACSNEIKNQAVATYQGVINTKTFTTDSFSSTGCNFGMATPTNFLVKIDNCKFTKKVVLCNNSVILTGPNGYDSYVWSKTLGGSSIGTGPTYTATQTGTYYVRATSLATCLPIDQEITVVPFGNTVSNPVIPYAQAPYAGSVTTCTINGKLLPNLFLCGANDFRDIKTGITDATSIIWEKLNENGTCPAATSTTVCANEDASCSWSQVGTGPDYKANTAGQFRLTINYTGGCFSVFYFNVFQNLLNPTVVSKDITCNTKGQITVNGIPASGYEYSLDNGGTGTYQASNVFNNVSAGLHNVYIRQVGVTNACLFQVLNVQILNRIYQVSVNVKQPLCNGGKGSVILQANNVLPQYYFSISQGATQVNAVGPINANDYTFSNLNPGTYTVRVWTDDGCDYSQNIDIINPPQLTATATLTKPLTCTDGEITIYPVGGTAPYIYYINSTTNFQSTPNVAVTNPLPTGGIYNITVEDSNNCIATTSATAAATPAPVFAIQTTNVLCYGDASGVIQFNVTSNAGGYTLSYSIDGGTTYSTNPVFSNLVANTVYTPVLRYTLDGVNYCSDAKPTVTLTGPNAAVTASAGVSELAGCGPAGEGKIRITNPQGGVAPYQYSFDNQATWITSNEAYKMPGTYTVYIKDANGCIYAMPNIIIDPKPVAPTIDVASPVYNCDGTANTTATITNPGSASYQYGYLLDGSVNTNVPSNVFVNIPSGSHTVSVTYKLVSVPTYSNLLKEDFGKDTFSYTATSSPDASSPGINPAFCWERQIDATRCNGNKLFANGEYTVTSSLRNNPYSGWWSPADHTAGSAIGRFLAVDAGTAIPNNAVLYRKTIKDIIPNQSIQVRFFATNLLKIGNTQPDASLTVELQNSAGVPLSSSSTGGIPKTNGWVEYNKTIDPGNNTTLDFVLRLEVAQVNGIDFAVDDIEVYQLPKSCITQVDFPFVVPTGKAFSGSVTGFKDITCAGANNGEITIAVQNFDTTAGFQYSKDGITWLTSTTSPVTLTNLSAGNYTPQLRYNAAGACPLTLTPVTIKAPAPLTVTATVTTHATCTTGATITASAGGGTPAYQYELRNTTGGAVVQAYQTNAQFTNVAAGNYTVFAKDANGCVTSVGAAVNVVAPPTLTATIDPSSDFCYDTVNQSSLKVNVSGGTAPFTYSLDGAAAQNSDTFTNVGVGSHAIVVTDSNNCTATISNISIAPQLLPVASITKVLDCSSTPNATITVNISGGAAPYTYTVQKGSGTPSAASSPSAALSFTYSVSNANADLYTFVVKDANGCPATTTATVNPITNPTATATPTDPTCNNGTDGQVQIIGAGGFGGFDYSFNGGAFSSTSLYTNLNANSTTANTTVYTYQVRDSKQCLSPVYSVTLNNPTKVVASATIPANTACSASTVVTVSGSGGAGGYTYSFNGSTTYTSVNTLTVTNTNAAQTITYSVKDSKGCIDTKTIAIPAYNPPTGITFSTPAAITCNATTTSITLTSVGGIAPLTYTIVSGPTTNTTGASSGTFTGLLPGNYIFEVKDANGCTKQASTTINPAPVIAVSGVKTDEKCFGATDGTATFTITGASASGNYNYTLSPNSGTVTKNGNVVTVTGLAANTYTLSVTDITTGCVSNVASVTVNPATQIAFTLAATKTNCNNKLSTISFPTLSGGTPGYTYAYAASPSTVPSTAYGTLTTVDTAVLTNNIDVYVKDLNGCFVKNSIVIGAEAGPTINPQTPPCYAGAPISVTIIGTSTGTTTYSKDGINFQNSPTFSLTPGSYTLTIKDGFGCVASTPYVLAPQLTMTATPAVDTTCTPNTTINLSANGGTGAYTYAVSSDGGSTYSGATNPYVTATAGTYRFRVTDSATPACQAFSTDIIVTVKTTVLTLTTTKVDVKCKGDATGSITITATSGKAPFTYSIDNGGTFVSLNVFNGLTAGTYNVVVKDALGCQSASTPVTIGEPLIALSATAAAPATTTCSTATTVTVTGHDGTAPYTYSFNGGAFTSTNTYVVNDNGTSDQTVAYQVKDANGCITVSQDIIVKKLNPPTDLTFTPSGAITCSTTTITVNLGTTGGTGTLQYETIAPSPIIIGKQTSSSFAGLTPGTYVFKVTDANGCSYTESYNIAPVTPIVVSAAKLSDVLCKGDNTGSIRFTVSGNVTVGNYTYMLTSGTGTLVQSGNTVNATNLVVGTYTLKVTDNATGCFDDETIIIAEPTTALSATITKVNANCFITTSKVTVTPAGGTASYTYAYKLNGVAPVAADYVASNVANLDPVINADWDVWVKDANGCTYKVDVNIIKDAAPTVIATATGQCLGVGSYTITATGAGGIGTLTYSINNGASYQAGNTFVVSTAGSYTIRVKDANGCTADSNTITVAPQLTLSAILNKGITCNPGPTAAQMTLSATGGTGPFTYESKEASGVYTPMASNVFTSNVAGSYTFRVTDTATGCTAITTIPIITSMPVNPDITGVTQTRLISCHGDADAAISIAIDNTKGQAPFVFNVLNTTTNTNYGTQTTGLAAGDYIITITDAKGCTDTGTISIIEPDAIVVSSHANPIICNTTGGVSKGSIVVDGVTGGTGSYKYYITGVNGYNQSATADGTTPITFSVIDFGLYQINVIDTNGCSKLVQDVKVASPPDDLDITAIPSGGCSTLSATVSVGASSTNITGSGPFHFAVYSPGLTYISPTALPWHDEDIAGSKSATISGLIPGVSYTFIVHDQGTGCYYYEIATPMPTNSLIKVNTLVANNVTCKGTPTGNVTFTMEHPYGEDTPVTYQIYDSQTITTVGSAVNTIIPASGSLEVKNFGGLPFGNYFVLITEGITATNAGCSYATAPFNITESSVDLTATASVIKNANCTNDGIIEVQGHNGTPGYTYQVTTSVSSPATNDTNWVNGNTFTKAGSLAGTQYYAYVKDAYGCIKQAGVILFQDAPPTISAPAPICYDGNTFTIDLVTNALASATILPATYSINGSAFQSSPSFAFNAAGTYNLVIKDGNGCTDDIDYIVYPKLNISATLTKGLDCTVTPAATITLTTTGGNTIPTDNYTYEVDNGGGFNPAPNPYTAVTAGTYVFRVTDANNATTCQTTTTFVLDPIPTTVFTTTPTNVSCNGGSDGTITVNVTSGEGPYEYSLSDGVTTKPFQPSNSFSGLAAGSNYVVTVRNVKQCTLLSSAIIINEPTPLAATSAITTPLTCGTGNVAQPATVTVTATPGTGTAPYLYSFDSGTSYSSTNTYQTYVGTTFDVYVKDANGCIFVLNNGVNIPVLNPPTDMDITGTPIWCAPAANTTSTVSITNIQNGVGTLAYAIVSGPVTNNSGASSGIFTGLTPGDYIFQVTDDNGCSYQELYTVKAVVPIAVKGALTTNISCNALNGTYNNGSITFTITGVSSPGNFNYTLSPSVAVSQITKTGNEVVVTGLDANNYTLTVTDITTNCTQSDAVTLTEPVAITFAANASNVFCSQDVSQITVSGVTGGSGVYTYAAAISGSTPAAGDYTTNPVIYVDTDLNPAKLVWDVYVKDSNGCISAKVPTTVTLDAAPTIILPASQCFTGTPLTVDLNSVTTTFNNNKSYTVNRFAIASSIATFNGPGIYTLGVKDDHGCEAFVDYVIEKQLLATATLTKDLYCTAPVDATIKVDITDGKAPYTYQMYRGGTAVGGSVPVVGTSFTAPASLVGTYSFVITDSNGASCSVTTNTVDVTTPVTPTFTPSKIDVSCNGGNDGSITVTPVNGFGPYTFALTGPVVNNTGDANGIYTGLKAGSYTIVMTDAKGCASLAAPAIIIQEPALLTATASASANTTCSVATVITVVGHDGTPTVSGGYYYSFDNGVTYDTSNTFTVNDNGTVQTIMYSVKDANGCTTAPQSIVVNPLNKPTDLAFVLTTAPTCPVQTATVTLTATNGVGALQYETIVPSAMIVGKQGSNVFSGLIPGDYTFQVTDANGCTYQELYKVDPVTNILVTGQLIANMSCNTGDDGKVNFAVSNFSGNYTYTITKDGVSFVPSTSSSSTTIPLTGLGFGVYKIDVTDSTTLCTSTASVTVAQPSIVTVAEVSNTNANCTSNALVKVAGNGGTPGYTYAYVVSGAGLGSAVFTASDSASLNPSVSTTWDFYAKDINGCISAPLTVTITTDPLPAGFTATATSLCPNAAGTFDITVNVGTGMGPFEYSIGSGFQSSPLFTVNVPKAYDLIVKDKFGCTATFTAVVTLLEPVALQTNITALPSCTDNDGVIKVSATGGSGNYVYNIDGGAFGAATTFSNVASGSHSMGVRDTTTLCEVFVPINLTTATPVTGFALSSTPVTCNGGSDGTITATMATPAQGVNDNPIYTYVLNGTTLGGVTVTRPSQASPIFNGLAAGNYTVVVTSGRGCQATASIPVTEPGIIIVPAPIVAEFGCTAGSNAMNFATITVNNVTGGSGTYSIYEFFKGGLSVQRGTRNVYTETDLAGGSYTVIVYDDKGCQGSTLAPITIASFKPMDKINVVVNQAINCTNPENITVTAVDASGVAITGVQYTLVDNNATTGVSGGVYNQTNSTGIFTGLPVANYIITATNPTTGCSIQNVHYVNEPNTFDLTIDNVVDATCFGGANGSANITIVDRTMPDQAGPFSYTLVAPNGTSTTGNSSTAGPLVLNALVAGNYTITATLTNNPFCSVSKVFTINQPTAALKISETHTPITCVGNDGTISATATGGWPGGYQFALAGPVNVAYSSQSNFTNLSAGLYTVSVKDSKGCVDQLQVTLVNPTPIVATIVADKLMLACFGDTNATITVQQPVTGGSGVYKYTLEATYPNGTVTLNGPQSSNVFTNLGAGSYKVIVSDTWSCSVNTNTVVINEPTEVIASLVKTSAQTCLSPASLTLSAAGGTGPYRYSTDPNFTNPSSVSVPFASSIIINVPFTTVPANYVYYVRDANGCSNAVSNSIDVVPLEPLDFTFENNNPYINCLGDTDGEITATAKGGLGNYVYTLLDGSGNALPAAPTQLTPGHFTQLAAGNYTLMVTSGDCTLRKSITITQPNTALTYTAAVTNVTCNGNGDGKVVLTGSGGTGVIKYAISPDLDKFLDSGTFLNLVVGHYQAIIQDVNGCNHVYDFDITEPAPITAIVDPLSIKQELCSGEKTGEFAITVTGGTAPYSTSIDRDAFVPNRVSFTGLSGGKHTVIVKDANLCEFSFDVLLNPAVTLDPVATISNDCVNNAPANKVTVHVDDSNNPADVTYSLDSTGTPQSSNVFTNVAPGNHFVMVQHKNGCVDATLPFTINQVDPLAISINLGGLNEIVATVTGGSGDYQFTVNGESIGSNNKYIYFHSGDYTVTVTDSYGCSVSATKYFEFIDIKIPPIFTPNGDGSNDNWKPTNTENYPDIKFIVYDRYGRQVGVFGAGQSWDGKYNGTELPMGDYWYILKLRHAQDDREFVGHFTLYR